MISCNSPDLGRIPKNVHCPISSQIWLIPLADDCMSTYLTKFDKQALVTIRNKLLSTLLKYAWTTGRHLFLIVGSPPSYLTFFLKCVWMSSIPHHNVTYDSKVQATSQNFQACSGNHLFFTV